MRVALTMMVVASAGCSSLLGIDDLRLADARGPGDSPGANCIGGGLLRVCPDPLPAGRLTIADSQVIDTSGDPRCTIAASGTTEVCVLAYASIEIAATGALRAVGSRPLALASTSSISILGTIDAASYLGPSAGAGADPALCPPPDTQTDGGGTGGSFGGAGGAGAGGAAGAPAVEPTEVRGGCAGVRGTPVDPLQPIGAGGGAVYLMAKEQIAVSGQINASGGGGGAGTLNSFNGTGGAGGGAGGLIGLDAPVITCTGTVFANGGGGGGGASPAMEAKPGSESPDAKSPGLGGIGDGNGGDGSVGPRLDGQPGTKGQFGISGGGGGGGAGVIYVRGTLALTGLVSPPPKQP